MAASARDIFFGLTDGRLLAYEMKDLVKTIHEPDSMLSSTRRVLCSSPQCISALCLYDPSSRFPRGPDALLFMGDSGGSISVTRAESFKLIGKFEVRKPVKLLLLTFFIVNLH